MDIEPLYWPLRRLDRAEEHIDSIEAEISDFLAKQPKPYRIVRELHPQKPGYVYRMKVREFPPDHITLILIDCVNHLRASLDNMIYSFIYWKTGTDPGKSPEFPVCETLEAWNRARWRLEGLPTKAVNWIFDRQPIEENLKGGKREYHPFWLLDTLWNYDKHRLGGFVAYVADASWSSRGSLEAWQTPRVYQDNSVVLTVLTSNWNFRAKFAVNIGFGPSIDTQYTAVEALRETRRLIRDVVFPEFAACFV